MQLAIDFGTSNSLAAYCTSDGTATQIPLDTKSNREILRSILYFPDSKTSYFGQEAVDQYTENDFQGRLMRSMKKFLPDPSFVGTEIDRRPYTLEQIIASFLRAIKERAEVSVGHTVDSVLIGRPARFSLDPEADQIAELRLLQAATLAGFKDIGFLAEPLAAAYSYRQNISEPKTVLISDLGGGTSDFTLIRLDPTKPFSPDDVLALHGVPVAGDALDGAIMRDHIAPYFGSTIEYSMPMSRNILKMPPTLKYRLSSPADLSLLTRSETTEFLRSLLKGQLGENDRARLERLFVLVGDNLGYQIFRKIEKLKIDLCTNGKAFFDFPYPDIEIQFEIEYKQFVEACLKELQTITSAIDHTLSSANLTASDIDLVVSTGGTSYVPYIQDYLAETFGADKIDSHKHFHSIIGGLCAHIQDSH